MFARGPLALDTRSASLSAWDFGGDGPDVLLVHGTGHNREVWRPLAERQRFRVIALACGPA